MIDYEARRREDRAGDRAEAVKNMIRLCYQLKQEPAVAKSAILEYYPDMDVELIDNIIDEVYTLQEA